MALIFSNSKRTLTFALALTVLWTTGCSTFSKKDCESMNWAEKGYHVAMSGQTLGEGARYYNRECTEKWGATIDSAQYKQGYSDGLSEFCTPENALRFASQGGVYRGICPKESESKMLPQLQTGQLSYLSQQLQDLREQMNQLQNELSQRDLEISDLRAKLSSRTCN